MSSDLAAAVKDQEDGLFLLAGFLGLGEVHLTRQNLGGNKFKLVSVKRAPLLKLFSTKDLH